jgi:hypothetical protein
MNGIEYIEQLMRSSIEMFFEEKHHIANMAIIAINSAAISKYAERKGIKLETNKRFFREIAIEVALPQLDAKEAGAEYAKIRNVFAHPDSVNWDKGQDVNSIDLSNMIFVYCHDLMLLNRAISRRIPAEVEAYTAWFMASSTVFFLEFGKVLRNKYPIFDNIDKLPQSEKIERGRRWLRWSVETYNTRQKELAECP